MLIALFTLLFTVVFGTSESPFILPKAEKTIKKNIEDKDRREEILTIMKNYKKEWKALEKTKKQQAKSLSKLNKDRNTDTEALAELLRTSRKQREKLNSKLIDGRIKIAGMIKQEEWDEIMKGVIIIKPKTEKKLTKAETKTLLRKDKKIAAIREEIEAAFRDTVKRKEVSEYLLRFEEDITDLITENNTFTYKDQDVLRDQAATREEVAEVIQRLEDFREKVHHSFLDLRKNLVSLSTEENWPELSKALEKFIKA